MTREELKEIIKSAELEKSNNMRYGQFVFNYIEKMYGVGRVVQYNDKIDCFFSNKEEDIDRFIDAAIVYINQMDDEFIETKKTDYLYFE